MSKVRMMVAGMGAILALVISAGTASAIPDTGTPSPNPSFDGTYCCNPANTNVENYQQGYHYVSLNDSGAGFVELNFVNPTNFPAYFEYRIDGNVLTSGTPHYTIADDYVYDFVSVGANNNLIQSFSANNFVEVRSAFGPERDYDFDWTRFNAAAVPVPATLPILLIGMGAIGVMGRRRKA